VKDLLTLRILNLISVSKTPLILSKRYKVTPLEQIHRCFILVGLLLTFLFLNATPATASDEFDLELLLQKYFLCKISSEQVTYHLFENPESVQDQLNHLLLILSKNPNLPKTSKKVSNSDETVNACDPELAEDQYSERLITLDKDLQREIESYNTQALYENAAYVPIGIAYGATFGWVITRGYRLSGLFKPKILQFYGVVSGAWFGGQVANEYRKVFPAETLEEIESQLYEEDDH